MMSKSSEHAIAYLKKSARTLKVLKIAGTVVGAALIAGSRWVEGMQFSQSSQLATLMLVVGIILAALGSLVLIFIDETAPEILAENINLERAKSQLKDRFDVYDRYQDHLLARVSTNSQVRDLLEKTLVDQSGAHDQLQTFAQRVLSIFAERRAVLFGIGDEYWNFSVYQYDGGTDRLSCIACRRDNAEDEKADHRQWEPGEGHVGLCFSRKSEIIFGDSTKPELRPVFEAKGQNSRAYDETRYVSLASIPISTDGENPLGVLIATSSQKGRFKNDEERGPDDWENADTLREVASSLAIVFQLIHSKDASGGSNDDGRETSVRTDATS